MSGPVAGGDDERRLEGLSRAQRRRARATRVADDAPQEGVEVIRSAEQAVLVALQRPGVPDREVDGDLDELELLLATAGGRSVGRLVQRRGEPDPATFVGRGKLDELAEQVRAAGADAVVFDDELSPAQQRNVEEHLGVKVLDRTIVILDIFARHASSSEGKMQVELAQLTYLLPRLRGWGHALSRQVGGIRGTRGPGETQLEVDRRRLTTRIHQLRRELAGAARTRRLTAAERERRNVPTLGLVGYTNAGKSTLLRAVTGSDAEVADRLFATLDTTARRLRLPGGRPAVLTDTVGFVRKLPTGLVEAFKSTLEETLRADVLVHVVDASHPRALQQVATVDATLAEIGAGPMPRVVALNKADLASAAQLGELRRKVPDSVAVSAVDRQGLAELLALAEERLPDHDLRLVEATVPYHRGDLVAMAHRRGAVRVEKHEPFGTRLVVELDPASAARLAPFADREPRPVGQPA